MMRRLYLHIGFHKTGSSRLQSVLRQNRSRLAEAGYLVPEPLRASRPQHGLAWLCEQPRDAIPRPQRRRFRAQVEHLLSQFRNTHLPFGVLSSENLAWLGDVAAVRRVARLLHPVAEEVVLVCAIRRQDELAVSHHQQGLRGWQRAYDYYGGAGAPMGRLPRQSWRYLDFSERLSQWCDAFGDSPVRLVVMEARDRDPLDLLLPSLDLADMDDLVLPDISNTSISAATQYLLEHLDKHRPMRTHADFSSRRKLTRELEKALPVFPDDPPRLRPARVSAEVFYQNYQSSNERLRTRFLPQREALFSEDFAAYPERDDREKFDVQELMNRCNGVISATYRAALVA